MPYIKVFVHFVWSTKNRYPYLNSKEVRAMVWNHIRENAKEKGIYIDFISGYSEHCHCLISIGIDQTIQKVMQLIKGESSYWINKNETIRNSLGGQKFEWQDEYFALSVSENAIDKVREYIKNQEEHDKKVTFKEEYDQLITKYGFKRFNE